MKTIYARKVHDNNPHYIEVEIEQVFANSARVKPRHHLPLISRVVDIDNISISGLFRKPTAQDLIDAYQENKNS